MFYLAPGGRISAAEVTTSPVFSAGAAVLLLPLPLIFFHVPNTPGVLANVTDVGKQFLFGRPMVQSTAAEYNVLTDGDVEHRL